MIHEMKETINLKPSERILRSENLNTLTSDLEREFNLDGLQIEPSSKWNGKDWDDPDRISICILKRNEFKTHELLQRIREELISNI